MKEKDVSRSEWKSSEIPSKPGKLGRLFTLSERLWTELEWTVQLGIGWARPERKSGGVLLTLSLLLECGGRLKGFGGRASE